MLRAIVVSLVLSAISTIGNAQNLPARLDLHQCLERALSKHPLLGATRARVEGAQLVRRYAGSRPNPSITVQTENWRFYGSPTFAIGSDLDLFIYGAQTIEMGGKAARRSEFAGTHAALAGAEAALLRWRIRQEVTRSFYRALQAQIAFEIFRENGENLEKLVEYTSLRVREGFSAEAELIRAHLERQTILNAEASAGQELEKSRLELLRTMGEQSYDANFILIESGVGDSLSSSMEALTREALEKRPDLLLMRAKLSHARSALNLAKAQARPDLDFSFGYKRTGSLNTMIAAVTIPLPIFNRKLGEIGQAAAEAAAFEQEIAATENFIRADLAALYRAASQLAGRIEAMGKDYLRYADDSRAIALVAYREGANDLYKVLDSQRARNEARLAYFRAKNDHRLALAELALATGREGAP